MKSYFIFLCSFIFFLNIDYSIAQNSTYYDSEVFEVYDNHWKTNWGRPDFLWKEKSKLLWDKYFMPNTVVFTNTELVGMLEWHTAQLGIGLSYRREEVYYGKDYSEYKYERNFSKNNIPKNMLDFFLKHNLNPVGEGGSCTTKLILENSNQEDLEVFYELSFEKNWKGRKVIIYTHAYTREMLSKLMMGDIYEIKLAITGYKDTTIKKSGICSGMVGISIWGVLTDVK